jgi:hypothetical protein
MRRAMCDCLIAFYNINFSALEHAAYKTIPDNFYYGAAASHIFLSPTSFRLKMHAYENYYAQLKRSNYFSPSVYYNEIFGSKRTKNFDCIAIEQVARERIWLQFNNLWCI